MSMTWGPVATLLGKRNAKHIFERAGSSKSYAVDRLCIDTVGIGERK
jgi:hypothetical protein